MYRPDDVIHSTYRIEKALSMRGPVITYSASETGGGKVVLRCLHVSAITDWSSVGRFEKAARSLKRLSHPGIPRVIDYFEDETGSEPSYCLVRKFTEGNTLAELTATGTPGDPGTAQSVLEQALDILSYLHSFTPPVIHSSIRPEHLVLSPEGKLSLLWNGQETDLEELQPERRQQLKRLDLKELGLTVLSFLHGLRYEELSYGDPYAGGIVPEPRTKTGRVLYLMIRQTERSSLPGPSELKRLLTAEAPPAAEAMRPSVRPSRQEGERSQDIPYRFDESGAIVRRMGNLSLSSTDERDVLTVVVPDTDRTENQLAKYALGAWLRWPWLVILILSGISGGSFFFPLFIFWAIPPARRFVKKLYSRFTDSRVVIDSSTVSAAEQLPPFPLRDINDIRIKPRTDEHGRISLEFHIFDRKGEQRSFSVHHLTKEQADAVSEFILKRIEERRQE